MQKNPCKITYLEFKGVSHLNNSSHSWFSIHNGMFSMEDHLSRSRYLKLHHIFFLGQELCRDKNNFGISAFIHTLLADFSPLGRGISLLRKSMNCLELLSECTVDKTMSLKMWFALKQCRYDNYTELSSTSVRFIHNFLEFKERISIEPDLFRNTIHQIQNLNLSPKRHLLYSIKLLFTAKTIVLH